MKRPHLLLLALLVFGCDEQLNAYEPSGKPYALFAELTPDADTQFVRVEPILEVAVDTPRGPLGADLTLAGPDGPMPMRDSLLALSDGRTGFLYWAATALQPAATYRIRATDELDRTTEARIAIPPRPVAERTELITEPNKVMQRIRWSNVPPTPARFRLRMEVQTTASASPVAFTEELTTETEVSGDTLTQTIPLLQIARQLRTQIGFDGDPTLHALEVTGRWPLPAEAATIENGYGEVTGHISGTERWTPSPELATRLGFRLPP